MLITNGGEHLSRILKMRAESWKSSMENKQECDGSGFLRLYDEYYDKIYVYIYRRVCNRHDAEDLTADVFLKAFASPHDSRIAKFSTYIYTIAGNVLKNHYRRNAKRIELFKQEEPDEYIGDDTDILGKLITREEHESLKKALAALPQRQYEAIYRRYYLDQPFKEIGAALNITDDAAKKLHKRAMESLLKLLKSGI